MTRSTSNSSQSDQEASPRSSASTRSPSRSSRSGHPPPDDTRLLRDIPKKAATAAPNPRASASLSENAERTAIETAARRLRSCEILLLVAGAGFSADSGLATYVDVADIAAYRKRGWRYRDLCRPLRPEGEAGGDREDAAPQCEGGTATATVSRPSVYPEEDDIRHPKYFYGFWGQCINDYRKVRPHEGYDIIARWGRDKNVCRKIRGGRKKHGVDAEANAKGNGAIDLSTYRSQQTKVARYLRQITQKFEQRSRLSSSSTAIRGDDDDDDNNDTNHDGAAPSRSTTQEPYHVSAQRAGAFFFFTSNVDAHSYDVFKSCEIRECHGNTELWQCTNFACGTNHTTTRGSPPSLDGMANGDEGKEDTKPMKWERRLWRLPLDHEFEVDPVTMSAPPTKGKVDDGTTAQAKKLFDSASKSDYGSSFAAKRQKSATAQGEEGYYPAEKEDENTAGVYSYLQHPFAAADNLDSTNNRVADESITAPAHIGEVHGKPRLSPLKNMNHPNNSQEPNYYLPISPSENWPKCPRCNNLARPAVLMFWDLDWVNNYDQEERWRLWCNAVMTLCKYRARGGNDSHVSSEHGSSHLKPVSSSSSTTTPQQRPLKVLILEVGCGFNVPTCRIISEKLVKDITDRGGDPTLVRINPMHPEADDEEIEDRFIGIQGRGLRVLKEMDKIYQQLRAESGDDKS